MPSPLPQELEENLPPEDRGAIGHRVMHWLAEWLTPSPQREGGAVYLPLVNVERRD